MGRRGARTLVHTISAACAVVTLVRTMGGGLAQFLTDIPTDELMYAFSVGADVREVWDNSTLDDLGTPAGRTGSSKWSDIAFAPNVNKLFSSPMNAQTVLIVDPLTNTTDTTSLGGLGTNTSKWQGIAFASTVNKLFAAPYNAGSVLVIDPMTNTTDTSTLVIEGQQGSAKWHGIAFVPVVNKLFAAPFSADAVLVVDPLVNSTDATSLAGFRSSTDTWAGIVFVPVVNKLLSALKRC